jgi:hypothetical protein
MYRNEFRPSTYMSKLNILKFICRNIKLKVITGMWHKPNPTPYKERLCNTCHEIDDEYHLLFTCTKYTDFYSNKLLFTQNFLQGTNVVICILTCILKVCQSSLI